MMPGMKPHTGWKAILPALLGLALALVVACGGSPEATDQARDQDVVTLGPENIAVVTMDTLRSGPTISGQVTPVRSANIRAEVSGAVIEYRAEQGDAVNRGAVLARIESAALQEAYRSAQAAATREEAALERARRDAERAATLEAAGAISQQALEEARQEETSAEAALTDAQARVSSAGKQLADATVRAPFRGIVSESSISLGDVVQPGTALFTVVDPSSMELEAAVPARDLALLERGTSVAFDVTGYPERAFTGRIDRISPSADPSTGMVLIYVTIPNAEGALVGGLFANGRVATEAAVGLSVPASAIDNRGLAPAVYRIRNGRVEKLTVALGLRDDVAEQVQLLSGVTAGDTLLLGSAQGLTEGTAVEVSSGPPLPADTSRTAQ